MERIEFDVDASHLFVGYDDAFGVAVFVDIAGYGQAGIGRCRSDELENDLMADEGLAAPVLGDVSEETVLDLVPFAGAGRQMSHGDRQAGFVGQALNLALPKAHSIAVAAAAIGGDHEVSGLGVACFAEAIPPASDALHCEGCRVGVDADVDPALVARNVV